MIKTINYLKYILTYYFNWICLNGIGIWIAILFAAWGKFNWIKTEQKLWVLYAIIVNQTIPLKKWCRIIHVFHDLLLTPRPVAEISGANCCNGSPWNCFFCLSASVPPHTYQSTGIDDITRTDHAFIPSVYLTNMRMKKSRSPRLTTRRI